MKKILLVTAWITCGLFLTTYGQGKTKVTCVGNSITFGYGLSSSKSYPAQLQNLLGTAYDVGNYGVSGRTLLKKGDRPYWNESAYTQALNSAPDIVIIMLGTNDSKSVNWDKYANEYIPDYIELIQSFRDLTSNPHVFICSLPPANNSGWDIRQSIITNEINPKILEIATSQGVNLVDITYAFQNNPGLLQSDGVHPNAEGAKIIAKKIQNTLSKSNPILSNTGNKLMVTEGFAYYWYKNNVYLGNFEQEPNLEATLPLPALYTVLLKTSEFTNDLMLSNTVLVEEIVLSTDDDFSEKTRVYYDRNYNGISVIIDASTPQNATFHLYNMQGQLTLSTKLNQEESFLSTNSIIDGIYYYQIILKNTMSGGSLIVR